ncbi:ABC transporter permease subunit [Saccharibacillus sp. CPCC 101409]|uniref:ABC transporter permease subunit n=1 Tax=Saccharibacillus sp. CPCC 101409 TaxID=3058041 RepID=UPI0026724140|nr:ABC transporter permease subunit [Saccharibacillus sp. CPCC 101409]MDO3408877.1 ABC transporter permease subunit [Saccharibacillus sp. CPCC 101409]
MTKLIQNEWLKQTKKKSFWVSAILMALIGVGATVITSMFSDASAGIGVDSAVSYLSGMMTASGMGQFATILSVVGTAGIVAQEYAHGTIKFLLIRSRGRGEILTSKYIAALLYTLAMTLVAALSMYIAGGFAFGFGGTGAQWLDALQAGAYGFVYSLVYVTLTFAIGTLTRSTGVAIGGGLTGTMFGGIIIFKDFYKYVLFPNADLAVYNQIGPPLPGMTIGFSLIVLAVYMALFLVAGYTVFRRRDVA